MSHAAPPPPSPPPPYICGSCRNPGPGAGACATCGADSWLVATYPAPPPPPPPPPAGYGMPPAQWGGQQGYQMTRQATFGEAIQDALKVRYATFEGRSSRSQYWWFALFSYIVIFAAIIVVVIGFAVSDAIGIILGIVFFVVVVGLIIPSICVTVRRLHDTNRSGWWYWIQLVPYVGPVILIVFCCFDGTAGPNNFGVRPGPYVS